MPSEEHGDGVKEAEATMAAIYTSEKHGDDETGLGTESQPFKTILQAMRHAGKEPFPMIYQDRKEEKLNGAEKGEKYEPASKSQLKKIHKIWAREESKNKEKGKRLADDEEKRTKNLEDAKAVKIEEDKSLPEAKRIKINGAAKCRGERVKIYGWVHRLRRQGKALMFITLRDGTGFLQSVLNDTLCQTYDALVLSTEASIELFGTLKAVPEGKTVRKSGVQLGSEILDIIS